MKKPPTLQSPPRMKVLYMIIYIDNGDEGTHYIEAFNDNQAIVKAKEFLKEVEPIRYFTLYKIGQEIRF